MLCNVQELDFDFISEALQASKAAAAAASGHGNQPVKDVVALQVELTSPQAASACYFPA